MRLDKAPKPSIVEAIQTQAPPEGVGRTNRGLTTHAEEASMEAECNAILAPPGRQLLPAVDGLRVDAVEYCAPPDPAIQGFVRAVCEQLDGPASEVARMAIRQGFRQFMDVVIRIQTKQANRREAA